ncbi:MAG TPA: MXAN_5808 family serine peptidase [Kofleriaceae bacterium]|nr:MXAN_5808 family serine peptidase [Kofleriaceae bacterium]
MRRFSSHGLLVTLAAAAALVLTVVKDSHEGVVGFDFQLRQVLAAPGTPATAKHDLTELKVFNLTLLRIRESYVDPSRIDPKKMLYQALDSVQLNIPEVLVEANPAQDSLTVVVNDKRQTFSTADVDSLWRLSGHLKKIFEFVQANMNPGADLAEVEYAATNGMLETLDPHSVLMDPEAARELDVSTSGKFGGLGIVIRMVDHKLTVIRPIKNTPASRAGIKAGDHIIKIDNQTTDVLSSDESVDRMRGDPATPVTLWVERKGEAAPLRFDLVRDEIQVESVQSKLLAGNVGWIKIKNFQGSTGAETQDAMHELASQGAQSFILDLRGNPGGRLDQAVAVADLFIDDGTLVTTVKGGSRNPRRATRGDGNTTAPMAVLLSPGSASASEIVAGALKNTDRAIVIGTRSFGKGSVQQLYRNEDDGTTLKLTVEQYLTPGDKSIQSVGIVPDIALQKQFVPDKNDGPGDLVRLLPPSKSWGEKDLDAHLTSQYAADTDKPTYELPYLFERPAAASADAAADDDDDDAEEPSASDDLVEDFEAHLADQLLATATSHNRPGLIKEAKPLVVRVHADEDKQLATALAKLGVDWTPAPATAEAPPKLDAKVSVSPAGPLTGGELVTVTGTVTNNGGGTAYRVHVRSHADDGLFDDGELLFGKIAPGETRTFSTRVEVPKDSIARVDRLTFDLTEARGATAAVPPVEVTVAAADRPTFSYAYQIIDDGNGDGLLQRHENQRVRVTVKNTGTGTAAETTAILRNASGDGVQLTSSRMELGALAPGAEKTVEFGFSVGDDYAAPEAVVELLIYDQVLGTQAGEKLKLPVLKSGTAVTAAGGVVEVKKDATEIRSGASTDTGVVARAAKGARFKVTGKLGPWIKIERDGGLPGFVAATSVDKSTGKPGNEPATPVFQVTPPAITLNASSYRSAADSFELDGKVTDDTHVEDVYVFVSNQGAKVETRKVFYRSNRGGKVTNALDFAATVPLWDGSNMVTVVARENADVRSMETLVIYKDSSAVAKATPAAAGASVQASAATTAPAGGSSVEAAVTGGK